MRLILISLFCSTGIVALSQRTLELQSTTGEVVVSCVMHTESDIIKSIDSVSSSTPLPKDTVIALVTRGSEPMFLEISPGATALSILHRSEKYYLYSTLAPLLDEDDELLNRCYAKTIRYPVEARRHGVDGTVIIDLFLGEDGRVIEVRTLTRLGYGLEEAVETAVRTCPIQPVRFALLPVKSVVRIPVSFRLD